MGYRKDQKPRKKNRNGKEGRKVKLNNTIHPVLIVYRAKENVQIS